jgi:NAD(P)-dependent dehydrogenase (short-subunit alcohol dehydrogenase family)
MLLNGKTAIIFGAGGAIGSAVARRFAAEGARLFLSGRSLSKVEALAHEIVARGAASTGAGRAPAQERKAANPESSRLSRSWGRKSPPEAG